MAQQSPKRRFPKQLQHTKQKSSLPYIWAGIIFTIGICLLFWDIKKLSPHLEEAKEQGKYRHHTKKKRHTPREVKAEKPKQTGQYPKQEQDLFLETTPENSADVKLLKDAVDLSPLVQIYKGNFKKLIKEKRLFKGGKKIGILIEGNIIGQKEQELLKKRGIPINIVLSPEQTDQRNLVKFAHGTGGHVVLAVPLEPTDISKVPSKKTLQQLMRKTTRQSTIKQRLRKWLDQTPETIGVMGQMGSKFTQDEKSMAQLLTEVSNLGLIFIDGNTTHKSVGKKIAQQTLTLYAKRSLTLPKNPMRIEKMVRPGGGILILCEKKSDIHHHLLSTIQYLKRKNIHFSSLLDLVH